jgi:hypothetical protein
MKKTTTVLAAILLSATLARATLITVDIGPPRERVTLNPYQEFVVPCAPPVTSLSGQTLSLDYRFNNNEFIRLYPKTSRVFDIGATMQLSHVGPMQYLGPFEAWTVDANGNRNSAIATYDHIGTGTSDGEFNYLLGFIFPLLADTTRKQLDFYGLHIDVTLPNVDYEILGGEFILAPNGNTPGQNMFGVGPTVPDTGATLLMLGCAVGAIVLLRRRICT